MTNLTCAIKANDSCVPCPSPTGQTSRTVLDRAGRVQRILEASISETAVPVGNGKTQSRRRQQQTNQSTDSSSGDDGGQASNSLAAQLQLMRVRSILAMTSFNMGPRSAGVGASGASTSRNRNAAWSLRSSAPLDDATSLLQMSATDLYPGGYTAYMAGWKQTLQANAQRRRLLLVQERTTMSDAGKSGLATYGVSPFVYPDLHRDLRPQCFLCACKCVIVKRQNPQCSATLCMYT